jgi:hypothetical protein
VKNEGRGTFVLFVSWLTLLVALIVVYAIVGLRNG